MSDDIYAVLEQKDESAKGKVSEAEFDKDAWAATKQAERAKAFEMIDEATEHITDDPQAFREYLDVMAQFPRHSVANTLLIFEQNPDATRIADFDAWHRMGESVKRGEVGITILEPGNEYTRDDGSIGTSFNTKKVFDVTQTTARVRLPRHADIKSLVKALTADAGVGFKTVAELPEGQQFAHYDHASKVITVAEGLDGQRLFKALTLELAHASLAEQDSVYERDANAGTALFAAYVVCKRNGIESQNLPAALVPKSDLGSLQEVREELGRIRDSAKDITDSMNKVLESTKENRNKVRGDRDGR
jgi:hypothetical protein